MTVTTALGRTINIHFIHSSHDFVTRDGASEQRRALDDDAIAFGFLNGLRDIRPRRLTLCTLSEVGGTEDAHGKPENYMVLGQGVGVCHPNDTFKKPVGRKAALTAAMKAAGLDVVERESIWSAYLDAFGVKKA
jgi:hypothetical protein